MEFGFDRIRTSFIFTMMCRKARTESRVLSIWPGLGWFSALVE